MSRMSQDTGVSESKDLILEAFDHKIRVRRNLRSLSGETGGVGGKKKDDLKEDRPIFTDFYEQ